MPSAPFSPLPYPARRSLLVYQLFFPWVALAMLPGLLLRMLRRGHFREGFGQRLGRYEAAVRERFSSGEWQWIHSVSVGETLIALKLAEELHRAHPEWRIVLTVTTSTGRALAWKARSEWLEVLYNPLDAASVVQAALDLIRPQRLILIEGEAWPNLLAACRRRGIPILLANARLSPRSERRLRATRFWVGPIFSLIDRICVPDAGDLARWQGLGVPGETLRVTGSIKFDSPPTEPAGRAEEFRAFLSSLGISPERPILLASSTWHPEEKVLVEIFLHLRQRCPGLFLILVPRHVERTPEILRELAPFGLQIVRRSLAQAATGGEDAAVPDLLLVDTTGELRDWHALATVVFVGKSLPGIREIGGQNPAEAAAFGKPAVFGPHMENFAALVEVLLAQRGALQCTDASSLLRTLSVLLADPSLRQAVGQSALEALQQHRGATAATAALIAELPAPASGYLDA